MDNPDKLEGCDFECCDICMESFGSHELTRTKEDLLLCTTCLEEYELST